MVLRGLITRAELLANREQRLLVAERLLASFCAWVLTTFALFQVRSSEILSSRERDAAIFDAMLSFPAVPGLGY
jgi:hypothetical protein